MRPNELIKKLKAAGFKLDGHGKRHDAYYNPETKVTVQVERHSKEIATGTLNQILKDAGLK